MLVEDMSAGEKESLKALQMTRELGAWHKQHADEEAAAAPSREEWMTALPAEFKRNPVRRVRHTQNTHTHAHAYAHIHTHPRTHTHTHTHTHTNTRTHTRAAGGDGAEV